MSYTLQIGPHLREVVCECCGKIKNRVWGIVSGDFGARAVYFALLNIDEAVPRVGLTLSVGDWVDQKDPSGRRWIQLEVRRVAAEVKMRVAEPTESNFYPWETGGEPLSPDKAMLSQFIDEFWAVADFIVAEDPALVSYLISEPVNARGREYVPASGRR